MPALTVPAIAPALPELLLAAGALVLVLIGAVQGDRSRGLVGALALALLVAAGLAVAMQPAGRIETFNGAFVVDGFARFMKLLTLLGAAASLILSSDYLKRERLDRYEYPILVVLATTGMLMMISANDLIALYVGVELQSLALYVIAAMDRDNARSSEAGLKYFVLGALSSGMLLYGASLTYGFSGTVSFPGIAAALQNGHSAGIVFGVVFLAAGLAFKISAVPFHMWTPDVYEGSPTPVTAFFAAATKMAAMAMTVRVFVGAFPGIVPQWQQIVVFIAIASMVLGAFAAIGQRNIKRLMAYSSIGHMGYALVGLAAGTEQGVNGVLVYMALYLAMTLGAFACIIAMRREGGMVEEIDDLAGLARSQPALAFCLAMLLFSLAGIPPLAGFFAKFYVFAAAIQAKLVTLAVIGIVASVVGAYYYIRIVKVMYFDEPRGAYLPMAPGLKLVLGVSSAVVVLFWLAPAPLVGAAAAAAKSLF
ncbi:NADH-quinone oxidoreductase subunit NuoN [Chelatococcus sp. SYSU_G07232]|uniref:NADH-quinone oxidoreductase subunit N n=1 Tax=Chelatococcus albus TaxID=3047466 RepID=A0ABT7AD70_9HYPH|nr:NADH-quinone oxidoreductase subunit NuoN [Chelatococcus sp. SYSU_G07232]MDJ1156759.1 NADH-quinone oxidoreductase subunit NuoN [Chelatococcus sp. SYSU_G07232]